MAAFTRERFERAAEQSAAPGQPGHHGSDRTFERFGSFPVREAFDVAQHDDLTKPLGQVAERPVDVAVNDGLEKFLLRRRVYGPRTRRVLEDALLEELVPVRGLTLAADLIEKHIPHDLKEPRATVRSHSELIETPERPHHRILHEILGLLAVAGESQGSPVQLVEVDECYLLELLGPPPDVRPDHSAY